MLLMYKSIQAVFRFILRISFSLLSLQIVTLNTLYAVSPSPPSPSNQEALRRDYFLKRMNEGKELLSPQDQERCQKLGLYPASCFRYLERFNLEAKIIQKYPRQVLVLTELFRKKHLIFNLNDEAMHVKFAFANDYLICPQQISSEEIHLCLPEALFKTRLEAIFKEIPSSELTDEVRAAFTSIAQNGQRMPLGR